MTFYATFGQGQYAGTLKDFYVKLEISEIARDARECRQIAMDCMNKHFSKWSNIYPDNTFNTREFPRGMLACLDENGNRLYSREVE